MTDNGIRFAFELHEELIKIITELAEEKAPTWKWYNWQTKANVVDSFGIESIVLEYDCAEVKYSYYRGCNEYEHATKSFSMQEIIDYADSIS